MFGSLWLFDSVFYPAVCRIKFKSIIKSLIVIPAKEGIQIVRYWIPAHPPRLARSSGEAGGRNDNLRKKEEEKRIIKNSRKKKIVRFLACG